MMIFYRMPREKVPLKWFQIETSKEEAYIIYVPLYTKHKTSLNDQSNLIKNHNLRGKTLKSLLSENQK